MIKWGKKKKKRKEGGKKKEGGQPDPVRGVIRAARWPLACASSRSVLDADGVEGALLCRYRLSRGATFRTERLPARSNYQVNKQALPTANV